MYKVKLLVDKSYRFGNFSHVIKSGTICELRYTNDHGDGEADCEICITPGFDVNNLLWGKVERGEFKHLRPQRKFKLTLDISIDDGGDPTTPSSIFIANLYRIIQTAVNNHKVTANTGGTVTNYDTSVKEIQYIDP